MSRPSLLFPLLFALNGLHAQKNFQRDMDAFRREDSISFPAKGHVLLIGSSSFTRWKDVQSYFPGTPILNRGFGGSMLTDLIQRRYEVIFPYRPRQILIYCGENDFAFSDTVTVDEVVRRYRTLLSAIRAWDPKVPVLYVSMKPSPSRRNLMARYVEANERIRKIMQEDGHGDYADVYTKMLKPDGEPMDDIFIADNLHMTAKGYAIWQSVLREKLLTGRRSGRGGKAKGG